MSSIVPVLDILTQAILKHAQVAVAPYSDPATGPPDPAFTLHLPDEVYTGSNLYAVQKFFDGEFQFDVFFESASGKHKLSCKCQCVCPAKFTHISRQLPYWTTEYQHSRKNSIGGSNNNYPSLKAPLMRWPRFPARSHRICWAA